MQFRSRNITNLLQNEKKRKEKQEEIKKWIGIYFVWSYLVLIRMQQFSKCPINVSPLEKYKFPGPCFLPLTQAPTYTQPHWFISPCPSKHMRVSTKWVQQKNRTTRRKSATLVLQSAWVRPRQSKNTSLTVLLWDPESTNVPRKKEKEGREWIRTYVVFHLRIHRCMLHQL